MTTTKVPGEQVGDQGARDPERVDAAVVVEVGVLGGEDRLAQAVGHLLEGDDVAALLAKLAQEHPVGAPDAQRHLGPVVGQGLDRRQAVVGDRIDQDAGQRPAGQHRAQEESRESGEPHRPAAQPAARGQQQLPQAGKGIGPQFDLKRLSSGSLASPPGAPAGLAG